MLQSLKQPSVAADGQKKEDWAGGQMSANPAPMSAVLRSLGTRAALGRRRAESH